MRPLEVQPGLLLFCFGSRTLTCCCELIGLIGFIELIRLIRLIGLWNIIGYYRMTQRNSIESFSKEYKYHVLGQNPS